MHHRGNSTGSMTNRLTILLFGSEFENDAEFDEFGAPVSRVNTALRDKLQSRRNAIIIWRIILFAFIIPEVLLVINAYADATLLGGVGFRTFLGVGIVLCNLDVWIFGAFSVLLWHRLRGPDNCVRFCATSRDATLVSRLCGINSPDIRLVTTLCFVAAAWKVLAIFSRLTVSLISDSAAMQTYRTEPFHILQVS
jgi:hypothetical protein